MPTFKSYLIGYIASILLILLAYLPVQIHLASGHRLLSHGFIMGAVILLAIVQMIVQLIFFLHLGNKNSRWNIVFLISTIGIVLIVVAGSVWIMTSLNNSMSSQQIDNYMQDQGSF
ncbi:MAG: cytochrome C oxidase subunit IV family protein [Candidatus Doudnabacteria bacterium]|nr:cytochrome C oxidase subunit IV family protein [Candidatus Doudnabacteria bacterium]